MAEEQENIIEELEAEEAPPEKKSPLKMIIILLGGLMVAAGGGYYAYMKYFQNPAPVQEPAAAEEAKKEPASPQLGVMFPLEPFIVNLAGTQGKRFLKVTVSLELSAPEVHAELKENLPKITDSILVLLSSKTFDDVYSIQGKFKLKDEVTTRVNRFLLVGHVKDAYFTEFIIQ
ncbi:MAG: flagellar basal body-associated protein FliL [Nitrospinaceae bacterium]